MNVVQAVTAKLEGLPEASAVALRLKADHYFDVIRALLDVFGPKRGLDTIYVTATIPSRSIIDALEVLEIDMERIWFVDCISQIMMSASEKHDHAIHVESPTMLENLMLKVEYLIRRTRDRNNLIVLDSINSLAIHNNTKILSEFLHILVNNLRSKGCYTVLYSMQEYETEEIQHMLSLVAYETIDVEGG